MINETGAHTKEDHMNKRSLGICFVGNFNMSPPPKEQWELGLRLVGSLCVSLEIPFDNVRGHNYYAGYKSCPGHKFSVADFQRELWDNYK
jgi:N-acetyl-anhydromuramyl-L-alanine amidase AmpD